MSSFNKIEKFNYTKNQEDAVSLLEYIVFEDEQLQEKYVVLKLNNNLNQRLYEVKLEISQYDSNNELLEKSNISYSAKVESQESFVPKAKLRLNYECKTISCKLIYGRFERAKFENGRFQEIPHKFEEHHATLPPVKQAPIVEIKKPKPGKRRFKLKNTFKKNIARFPKFVNGLTCLICIALFVGAAIYVNKTVDGFYYNGFIYEQVSENKVAISKYSSNETSVVISGLVEKSEISIIKTGAFKDSNVEKVRIANDSIAIRSAAFENCDKLNSIIIENNATILSNAFVNCPALSNIDMANVALGADTFVLAEGQSNINYLEFSNTKNNCSLTKVFGLDSEDKLYINTVLLHMDRIEANFLNNIEVGTLIVPQTAFIDSSVIANCQNIKRFNN